LGSGIRISPLPDRWQPSAVLDAAMTDIAKIALEAKTFRYQNRTNHAILQRDFSKEKRMNTKNIPVTVISGFLGAGKTTLVNHLLAQNAGRTIGVIVNEFGEVGIDGDLIVADDNPLIEIRNGCICCTVRSDLVAGVKALLATDIKLERLIIETSGLADPAPVLQTFLADADLLRQVELESVVTLVDAANFHRQIDDGIANEQIAFADLVVLNKVDLMDASALASLERSLRSINPVATIIFTNNAEVSSEMLLGVQRFSLPNLLAIEPGILEDEHDHEHDNSITSFAMESTLAIDAERFSRWATQLTSQPAQNIMRMKGVLNFDDEARQFYFHSVHMLTEAKPGKRWANDTPRISRLVVIGRHLDIDALQNGFSSCAHSITNHAYA
jgi:G3E family GTPase